MKQCPLIGTRHTDFGPAILLGKIGGSLAIPLSFETACSYIADFNRGLYENVTYQLRYERLKR
jgi:hypothetical protein